MPLPSVVAAVATAGVVFALVCVVLLAASARARAGVTRRAHRLLAAGVAIGALTTAGGIVAGVAVRDHVVHGQPDRTALGGLLALGVALSGGLLLAGLLLLPGSARSRSRTLRYLLDALVIAAAVWFVGWVAVSKPARVLGEHTPLWCVPLLVPAAIAALALGVGAITAMRAPAPRGPIVWVGAGVTLAAVAGMGLAGGVCQGMAALVDASAVALPAALGVVAFAARRTDRPAAPPGPDGDEGFEDEELSRRGSAYAFLPMAAMAASALIHLVRGGTFDMVGIVVGSLEGFALVGRQFLALRDVKGYAERLRDREAYFRELAHTDPLTGLANRRGLLTALEEERAAGAEAVLLALDLDGFKNVNDMRGHDVGDAVLVEVGQRLRMNLRPGDVAARLGGDEFAVLMWARPAEAKRAAARLLGALGGPYEQETGTVFLSVSIGLAGCATVPDVTTLLRNADIALRWAKSHGKNRVELYDIEYDVKLRRRTELEHELRGAIDRDELHLQYQPVVILPDVRPVGAEALLRWQHPTLGKVGPDEFIPLAEECGMINRLGAWVLHQACHQLSRWLAEGHDVWVSVNVSPRELHATGYVDQVKDALRAHRVPPQRLVLEVTEHAVSTDVEELIRRLRDLRETGVRIALDDFGAGYSSLGQLRRLPVDILKIDHSLVVKEMVKVVVAIGHQFGLEVIAEGIGEQPQMAMVVDAGCKLGQGYLSGWPVPAEHFEARLESVSSPARVVPVPGQKSDRDQNAGPTSRRAQNMRAVDSAREMRQA
ncbi:bifunctional diguanylate cyclase/phosphodiesterase [Phytohabitans sp. ZYX-F-186]|uniref:Bifunctional diguanylate cyclase/phosphodiesterase n=1 Tax=Phytohabitans maris TaxID=3071409 RepID=A0ABU0ZQ70_9ACTN|nr:bifunctional diguanylate cyclase/phosphodiesterase [Phytohabitans sp. ZYX-F-186]MDQ7909180.1 bifunctional diguanylate cyclase/phosphodiesterase [Phytohabitans sp. ZYX-F-186]